MFKELNLIYCLYDLYVYTTRTNYNSRDQHNRRVFASLSHDFFLLLQFRGFFPFSINGSLIIFVFLVTNFVNLNVFSSYWRSNWTITPCVDFFLYLLTLSDRTIPYVSSFMPRFSWIRDWYEWKHLSCHCCMRSHKKLWSGTKLNFPLFDGVWGDATVSTDIYNYAEYNGFPLLVFLKHQQMLALCILFVLISVQLNLVHWHGETLFLFPYIISFKEFVHSLTIPK